MINDRFKFRVWNKRENCYICPPNPQPLLQGNGLLAYFTESTAKAMDFYDIEFCTGLKDQNGKLIYEGDLIKEPANSHNLKVMWENGAWQTEEYRKNGHRELLLDCLVNCYGVEIVGNIHETPELLKDEE